jgi:DNA-binding response OmpR family regulator
MGEVAIGASPSREAFYSPFVRCVKDYHSLYVRLYEGPRYTLEIRCLAATWWRTAPAILNLYSSERTVPEVGILIIDDDVVSQRALKNVLDSEGWRVRVAPLASEAMAELASGRWNLVIVNIALTDVRGQLFSILKELAQTESYPAPQAENEAPPKRIRVLFLVPLLAAKHAQPILEQESLPYSLKPYHLHDFLEKVSELLVESGALAEPIRSMGDFSALKKRQRKNRNSRDSRKGAMFASREDYQMSEEELVEFEKQDEEDRKKREKELHDRQHLG